MVSWIRQFCHRIWPTQLSVLRRILFRSVLLSPICSRTSSLVTFSYHIIFSILLQHHISSSQNNYAPIILMPRSLNQTIQYYWHFFISFLFSPTHSRISSLVNFSDHFIFSILIELHISNSQNTCAPILLIYRSLNQAIQCCLFK